MGRNQIVYWKAFRERMMPMRQLLYIHHLWATDNQLINYKTVYKRFTQIINETHRCMQTLLQPAARGI